MFLAPFTILGGATDYLLGSLVLGGQGSITGMGNVAPRVCCKAFELASSGNNEEAHKYAGVISNAELSLGRGAVVGTKVGIFLGFTPTRGANETQYATVLANSYPPSAAVCRKPLLSVTQGTKSDVDERCDEIIELEKRLVKEGYLGRKLQSQRG